MWLVDVEQHVLTVGSRVCILDGSDMNGRTGVICGEKDRDTEKWRVQIDEEGAKPSCQCSFLSKQLHEIVLNVHEPLPASNGLYIQPYCASVTMPPLILSRCVLHCELICCFSFCRLQIQTFRHHDGQGLTRRSSVSAPYFVCFGSLYMWTKPRVR